MIRYHVIVLLFLFCHFDGKAQTPFTCSGQYYLSLTKSGSQSSGLYEVKISVDGSKIFFDTISSSIGLVLNAMGYRITDNFIYGIDPVTARLRRIGSDAGAIDLGVPKDIPLDRLYYAGDVSPDGRYLLLIGLGGANPQIVRVDLESPDFQCTFVSIKDRTVGIVDIAFDPFTGILYGHDLRNKRLITIDPQTGDVNSNFVVQPQIDQLGALFFDSFGNLYGYGAFGTFIQDKFVSVDKKTGVISLLAQGPISSGQDGCACPYTLELQKTVTPNVAYPCTEVVYDFIVSNGSGIRRQEIALHDTMPVGLIAKAVISNPFGGNVVLNGNILSITNMTVPVGVDTVRVLVEIGPGALGLYRNQAVLSGLPPALGSFTLSDDPNTFMEEDSTDLLVVPLDFSFINEVYSTCPNDSVLVDATLHGLTYLWNDGDTLAAKWLPSPGNYSLVVKSLCDIKNITIEVRNDVLGVNIPEDSIFVLLGEEVFLTVDYVSDDNNIFFKWYSTHTNKIECPSCQQTKSLPLVDGYFFVQGTDSEGCTVKDSVYIRVKKDRSVFVPNIFTPNNDGVNDNFFLFGNALASEGKYLRIYDRWGNLVFNGQNYKLNDSLSGWDGSFDGKDVVSGVFTWISSILYIDGFEQILKGDVLVLR